jgi:hypothetical protein
MNYQHSFDAGKDMNKVNIYISIPANTLKT